MSYPMNVSNSVGHVPPSLDFGTFAWNAADGILWIGGANGAPIQLPSSIAAILASAALTGKPTAPDPAAGDASKQIPNTEWVAALLAAYAPLNSAVLTGTPTLKTAPVSGDNSQALATTAFAQGILASALAAVGTKGLSFYAGATPTAKLQAWAASGDLNVRIDQDFTLTATVNLPAGCLVIGDCHKITKGFNGDMFNMNGYRSTIRDLYLFGGRQSGNFTGRGIVITGTPLNGNYKQTLLNVDITDMDGYCLEFVGNGAGMQFLWMGGNCNRYFVPDSNGATLTSQMTLAAIKLPGNGKATSGLSDPVNDAPTYGFRRFVGLQGNGGTLIDFSSSNLTDLLQCDVFNVLYRDGTRYAKIQGGRIPIPPTLYGIGQCIDDSCTMDGANNPLTLGASAQQCHVRLCYPGFPFLDSSTSLDNQIYDHSAKPFTSSFTPQIASPYNFAIGNGSITGTVIRVGTRIVWKMKILLGSTSAFPNDGAWIINLPSPYGNYPHTVDAVGTAFAKIGGAYYTGAAVMAAGSASVQMFPANGGTSAWGNKVPAQMNSGDYIEFSIGFDID